MEEYTGTCSRISETWKNIQERVELYAGTKGRLYRNIWSKFMENVKDSDEGRTHMGNAVSQHFTDFEYSLHILLAISLFYL